MSIFKRKIKVKEILQLEQNIAELLKDKFPQLNETIGNSTHNVLTFIENPESIFIIRAYKHEKFKEIERNHRTHFNLKGIFVLNLKTNKFEELQLNYLNDALTKVTTKNSKYLHKYYDLKNIKIGNVQLEILEIDNPDRKKAEKILQKVSRNQLDILDMDSTFEIEINEKSFYTILDMEDGNFIAVDKLGKIYKLYHDDEELPKLIAQNTMEFYEIYNGNKFELEDTIIKLK